MADQSKAVVTLREPWYRNPTFLWIIRSTAVNFVLPFFNGVMLGFGEILANELVFKYGWFGYSRVEPATALGLRAGVPPSSTADYKKVIQADLNRKDQEEVAAYPNTLPAA
ncbi:outer membrane protein TOM13-domain-containing protein [Syncephalastrum racemosum]|uniref:Outer membrane protein TOM13-domain-containing protein n=1 Tax=Syncephalastrum racemosum TaxID=13706 RepID=A0A1X2HKP9_SYNRA|nr:outer membrane protein TOM13-domain-containing protein [Syncephalastrum racemosum]